MRKGKSKAKAQLQASAAPKRSPSPASEDDIDDNDVIVPPRASLAQEFEKISKAEGKRPVSTVKGRGERVKVTEERKEGTKVTAELSH